MSTELTDWDNMVTFDLDMIPELKYYGGLWVCEYEDLQPGDSVGFIYMRPLSESHGDGEARYVEIPSTSTCSVDESHGDHIGASNFDRLVEDFGDWLIRRVNGGYASRGLYLRVGSEIPESLVDAVQGLCDYPVYDEEDYMRREREDFEYWLLDVLDFSIRSLVSDRYNKYVIVSDERQEYIREEFLRRTWSGEHEASDWFRAEEVREDVVQRLVNDIHFRRTV